ncbi:hypothetical protein [Mesorhizobium sp.]|uniref:hypothetical protein n=1 Tax=Mesorhizobium sp. TaxID=1871066 RepID=UPI000FE8CCA7|nr:hypothetical protein [Mesorhizobium sp.]RWC58895.1 MAG: hypothetical protein EOS56_18470 [Mesorhizobium sp.]RWC66507.1 MAG: hypothetical protein EOS29_03825 [Mesorhizobium sp.]
MGERMSLELSDGLAELDGLVAEFQHEPRIFDPNDARILGDRIKQLRRLARDLENRLSRDLWNGAARTERDAEAERIAEAAFQPGSNVCLFPVIPRPFSDGRPGGRA